MKRNKLRRPLTADEIAARVRAGGKRGGKLGAKTKAARRVRYLAGELRGDELAAYEALLVKLRAAGSKGGRAGRVSRKASENSGAQNQRTD